MHKHIDKFMLCIEEKRFYDAHEALEELWFPRRFEKNDEVKLLKGFINAAVSFELKKRGREEQSKKVWANYLKYRQVLFQVNSPYKNKFHKISRFLEEKNREISPISH